MLSCKSLSNKQPFTQHRIFSYHTANTKWCHLSQNVCWPASFQEIYRVTLMLLWIMSHVAFIQKSSCSSGAPASRLLFFAPVEAEIWANRVLFRPGAWMCTSSVEFLCPASSGAGMWADEQCWPICSALFQQGCFHRPSTLRLQQHPHALQITEMIVRTKSSVKLSAAAKRVSPELN